MGVDIMQLFVIALATLLGPVLAVQAQKWVERAREKKNRKEWVFHQLMVNRGARLSSGFVQALNTIDMAFNGGKSEKQSKSEKTVINAWRSYHDKVTNGLGQDPSEAEIVNWNNSINDLVVSLLSAISEDLGYSFDQAILRGGWYLTKATADHENDITQIRKALVSMTKLEAAVPVLNVQPGGDGKFHPVQHPGT